MTTNTTQSDADAIRQRIEAVIERHVEHRYVAGLFCVSCSQRWPCDAHRMASALLDAVTALEDARSFLDAGHDKLQYDPDAGDYDLMGDYETDARYIYPARERWMRDHLDSALAAVRRMGERDE